MTARRVALVFLLVMWGAGYVAVPGCCPDLCRVDRSAAPEAEPGDLPPDPALVTGALENGFRYVLMKNSRPENRVILHLMIEAGSMHEADDQQGLAHYLEHMLFNGTTHFPPGELVKYFQSIGMGFGNDANAQTGFFRTVYDLNLPSGDVEHLRQAMRVMVDYAQGALLLESEVEKERGVILAEKRERDTVSYRTFTASLGFELAGSRLVRRYPIGVDEVLQTAGRDHLKVYYDTWYRPERMTLVMAGDFDPDTAVTELRAAFAAMNTRAPAAPVPDIGTTAHKGVTALYHYEKEAGATEVSLETLIQAPQPPDSAEEKKRRFVRDMAYRIVNYRLNELEESPDPPFTSAVASAGRAMQHYEYASISATAAPDQWESALTAVEQVIRAALVHGFTRSEVDRVRRESLAEMDRAVRQAPTRESEALAGQIVMSLAQERVFQSPEQERDLLAPVAQALTPEMLHEALVKTWEPDARQILVTGNAVIGGDAGPEENIRSVYEASLKTSVQKPEEKAVQAFPYLPDPQTKGRVSREVTDADIGVTRVDFENQVRLNMKKTDFKVNQVVAEIRFGRGESAEPENLPALCELGEGTVNESGFGGMKKEEMRLALAGKKAGIAFSVEEDRFLVTGSCASDEVRLLFQLFYAFFNDWTCREEAYLLTLDRFRQEHDELRQTIAGAMPLEGDRFLAGGDSRFGLPPDFTAFEKVSLNDIRSWMAEALKQSLPEISVAGDFDPSQVEEAAALYFGGRTQPVHANPGPDSRKNPAVPAGEAKTLTVPTKIPQAYVEVAWPTDDFWDIGRTRRFMVLSHVFSDRMRRIIREEDGQSYSQYAYHDPSQAYPGYGVFHAAAEIKPGAEEAVIDRIRAIAADLADHGVTPEELERAREPILTGIRELVKTNDYWLRSVLSGCRSHPERLDWSRNFINDYQSVTTDEMTGLVRRYLADSRCVRIIVRPEEAQINP
ncbi:MAG: insulinase family protein [Thermodesulfobacteriota bacterium]